ILEELLHAARLELEDAFGLARREELVRRRVVERNAREIELSVDEAGWIRRSRRSGGPLDGDERRRPRVDEADRDVEHRQRLEAEEVELDEARLLDVVLVVLRDERAEIAFGLVPVFARVLAAVLVDALRRLRRAHLGLDD